MEAACCKQADKSFAYEIGDDPFSQMAVIDYYDGSVSGFMKCKRCLSEYRFYLLDWDAEHDVRIFALARVPMGTFVKLAEIFKEAPGGHVWIPALWKRASEEEISKVYEDGLQELQDAAAAGELVIAWSARSVKTLAMRGIDPSLHARMRCWFDVNDLTEVYDWFGYLLISPAQANNGDEIVRLAWIPEKSATPAGETRFGEKRVKFDP